jgi:hypothetical protein
VNKFQKIVLFLVAGLGLLSFGIGQLARLVSNSLIDTSFTTTSAGAKAAIDSFNLQSYSDTNIYQQQVTALWANKNLLKVVADQTAANNAIGEATVASNLAVANAQTITNWLLLLLLLAIVVLGFAANRRLEVSKRQTPATPDDVLDS